MAKWHDKIHELNKICTKVLQCNAINILLALVAENMGALIVVCSGQLDHTGHGMTAWRTWYFPFSGIALTAISEIKILRVWKRKTVLRRERTQVTSRGSPLSCLYSIDSSLSQGCATCGLRNMGFYTSALSDTFKLMSSGLKQTEICIGDSAYKHFWQSLLITWKLFRGSDMQISYFIH